jgi:alanine-glyoxylate transaminase / serine-glyoxylate transaminase / serine-pyruvate transaminase
MIPGKLAGRIPERLLLGPGPSNAPASVREAAAQPLLGHLDPAFSIILEEIRAMLRGVFQTANEVTFAVSGTGSAGMEALAVNLFEPGDKVLVGQNGIFGTRICEALEKLGAEPIAVQTPWGTPIDPAQIEAAWKRQPGIAAVWIVHAETSTGLLQPGMEQFGAIARNHGGLFLVDCVTSLGGAPVAIDAWQADAAFSGTQKCLNVSPGLAPVTFNDRALQKIARRKFPVPSWYFDLSAVRRYWQAEGGKRLYHHTAPITSLYMLHEGLRLVLTEGLEACWARHRDAALALTAALKAQQFSYRISDEALRLPMLHAVVAPAALREHGRQRLLAEHGIEVGAALGAWSADTWRIGLMGANARRQVVDRLVSVL